MIIALSVILVVLVMMRSGLAEESNKPWQRHVIDDSSRGADGTRLADANGDGLLDIATGWEQGGVTRVYLHPGRDQVKQAWPAVTVGPAASVEDAVLVDLDGDGAMDVVSCCEGSRQVMLVHWAPTNRYLDPKSWKTEEIPGSEDKCRWMFSCPVDVDQDGRIDLVAGGKGTNSQLGWWKVPEDPRNLLAWEWHPLRQQLGWVMSIEAVDMDGDRDLDILFTDRKGSKSGCFWLEHPGAERVDQPWREHAVGLEGKEAMFLSLADVDRDGLQDVIVSIRPQTIVVCRRQGGAGRQWESDVIAIPESFGSAKDAAAADLDQDGQMEIVFTTERASNGKIGVGCVINPLSEKPGFKSISGVDGTKHDLVQLLDLDGDGDLDILTCEEVNNLGVIWYENPLQ
ncbi:MAG: VCBS repeat-containing protein [Rubripirellula sp.]|nr:VCBS repeat-containing protein [Rubripirellula sp.]